MMTRKMYPNYIRERNNNVSLRVVVQPSTKKTTLLNSNSIGNSRATGLSVARLLRAILIDQSIESIDRFHVTSSGTKIQI